MKPGTLITFFNKQQLQTGICRGDAPGGIMVLCADATCCRLPHARIIHAGPAAESDRLQALNRAIALRTALANTVDVGRLWHDLDRTGDVYSAADLARCAFGDEATPDHEAALLTACLAEGIHFKFQCGALLACAPRQVADHQRRALRQRLHRRRIDRAITWLRSAVSGNRQPGGTFCITLLKDFAARGPDSRYRREAQEILAAVNCATPADCFALLVRLDIWKPDHNILLSRWDVPHRWPREVTRQAHHLAAEPLPADLSREDLTGRECITIDEPFTRDIDDALDFRWQGNLLELGIHITDASAWIAADSPLEREASRRGATLYMPEGKVPMIPAVVSERCASLRARQTRPAISFLLSCDADGTIHTMRATRSLIRIARRMTYQQADAAIRRHRDWQRLSALLDGLRNQRFARGACNVLIPELQVRVNRAGTITCRIRDKQTPAQLLVSECMILANTCAARVLADSAYPALYRCQAAPSRPIVRDGTPSLHTLYTQRRWFRPVMITTRPGPHSTLGVAGYTSITSPLRKYLDLVSQRQLAGMLAGAPPPRDTAQLETMATQTQMQLSRVSRVSGLRTRYWVLKFLKQHRTQPLAALVLARQAKQLQLLLTDYLLESCVPVAQAPHLQPGDACRVVILQVDPHQDRLTLQYQPA